MKTLVIHPKDATTDFLQPIYKFVQNKTVITEDLTEEDINRLINSHDRVIMLGHGCEYGLFSMDKFGFVISSETSTLLAGKDNIYIWCNAADYVRKFDLTGFYSGMFISETYEATYCNVQGQSQKDVDESNNTFAEIVSRYAHLPSKIIHTNVMREYAALAATNRIAAYNYERLCAA